MGGGGGGGAGGGGSAGKGLSCSRSGAESVSAESVDKQVEVGKEMHDEQGGLTVWWSAGKGLSCSGSGADRVSAESEQIRQVHDKGVKKSAVRWEGAVLQQVRR